MKLFFWLPTLAYGILIFTLSHQSNPPGAGLGPDYVMHFIEYGLFALTVVFGLTHGFRSEFSGRLGLMTWGAATLFGFFDELHQYFIPNRVASIQDVAADSLGAAVVVTFCLLLPRFWRAEDR